MTPAQRSALKRVATAITLYQSDVSVGERQVFLDLIRMGMIVEEQGSWSGKAYWEATAKGRKEVFQ